MSGNSLACGQEMSIQPNSQINIENLVACIIRDHDSSTLGMYGKYHASNENRPTAFVGSALFQTKEILILSLPACVL